MPSIWSRPRDRILPVVARHALARSNPRLAAEVSDMLNRDIVVTTSTGYDSATKCYLEFCDSNDLTPWPADGMVVAAWIWRISTFVKPTSLKVYLSSIRRASLNEGHGWALKDNEFVRRAQRWVKRTFPCPVQGLKFAVTLQVLKRILPLLEGWPYEMSRDDLLFACASIIGVTAFLRGGEFLAAPGSVRPILKLSNLCMRSIYGKRLVVVSVPQPKARWWLSIVDIPCFEVPRAGPMSPVSIMAHYLKASPLARSVDSRKLPAFHFRDGSPLTRDFLTSRTAKLCAMAGIPLVDARGRRLPMKMASWRAGAVRSAVDAGLSEPMIMELGRWKSTAWRFYLLHTPMDVQGAACRMWEKASSPTKKDDSHLMGSFQGAVPFQEEADRVAIDQALAHAGILSTVSLAEVGRRATATCASLVEHRLVG